MQQTTFKWRHSFPLYMNKTVIYIANNTKRDVSAGGENGWLRGGEEKCAFQTSTHIPPPLSQQCQRSEPKALVCYYLLINHLVSHSHGMQAVIYVRDWGNSVYLKNVHRQRWWSLVEQTSFAWIRKENISFLGRLFLAVIKHCCWCKDELV